MIIKHGTGELLQEPDSTTKTASAFTEDDWHDLLAEDSPPQED